MTINLNFLRSECPGVSRDAAKIAVFPGFWQYFGLNIVFSFISVLHMTGYNIQSEKIHAEKDRKQENKKKWKW